MFVYQRVFGRPKMFTIFPMFIASVSHDVHDVLLFFGKVSFLKPQKTWKWLISCFSLTHDVPVLLLKTSAISQPSAASKVLPPFDPSDHRQPAAPRGERETNRD
jgi:hypothetical protein